MSPRNKSMFSNTALLSKATARATSLFGVDEGRTYQELALDRIGPAPGQPRTNFDQAELDGLAASIEKYGLLQPIIVREVGADCYQIIAGERRFRAMVQLGREVIPAIVMTCDDPIVLALVENVQRADLHVIEIATSLQELIGNRGLTQAEAGVLIGNSQAHVARLLGLLRLPREILDELPRHRAIAASLLLEIAETDDPALQWTLWQQAKAGLTVRGLRQVKQERKATAPEPCSWDKALKGLRRHVQVIGGLRQLGVALSPKQAEELRSLRREIDDLLC